MVEEEHDRGECSVLSGLDPLALFAMYAEDEQLYISVEEAGKLLADAFPLARAKGGAEGRAFVKAQLARAECQGGKIGVAAWMRFWPLLVEHANSLPAVSVTRPWRLDDREFKQTAAAAVGKLQAAVDAAARAEGASTSTQGRSPRRSPSPGVNGERVISPAKAQARLEAIRGKVQVARDEKRRLQDELRTLADRREVLMASKESHERKREEGLVAMEARLAQLQRVRDEAKLRREEESRRSQEMIQAALGRIKNIGKRDLDEMRAMRNPPVAVKRTLEAVYLLLESAGGSAGGAGSKWTAAKKALEGPRSPGSKTSIAGLARTLSRKMSVGHVASGEDGLEWDRVIARICKPGLVDAITQFDVAAAAHEDVRRLQEHVTQAKLTSEAVGRASKACEPLWVWVQGQLQLAPLLAQHTCSNLADEEAKMQAEIQRLLKEIMKHNLLRMDNASFCSVRKDAVAERARVEQKQIEKSMLDVEGDIAAMQGVIEKGTRLERELLASIMS